jgi:hypothetical protein
LKRSKKRRLPRWSDSEDGHYSFRPSQMFQSYDSARQGDFKKNFRLIPVNKI